MARTTSVGSAAAPIRLDLSEGESPRVRAAEKMSRRRHHQQEQAGLESILSAAPRIRQSGGRIISARANPQNDVSARRTRRRPGRRNPEASMPRRRIPSVFKVVCALSGVVGQRLERRRRVRVRRRAERARRRRISDACGSACGGGDGPDAGAEGDLPTALTASMDQISLGPPGGAQQGEQRGGQRSQDWDGGPDGG